MISSMKKITSQHFLAQFVSIAVIASFALLLLPAGSATAQSLDNPITANSLEEFLRMILAAVIAILFPIVVLFIVYTGFLFVTAQGNPQKINEAKTYLIYTVIGALIVLGAQALSLAIEASINEIQSAV